MLSIIENCAEMAVLIPKQIAEKLEIIRTDHEE
ncbi:phage holin family protein [Staphylococcus coagulans]|nr:phage holin family protein [Staphylococcus coagulans]MDU9267854.1 phage holin family protein [Staphylococcus coagulans]MDU9279752.1 phage holin family protein [Staphylococcus coagulans]MDU9291796.1 phage holin family protein [Staphylococcus coagulans]MDU9304118.1 phage holin family protein [Staphylococcus coagulans]MDU9321177.1 phage holin family protein [Staphylococcus coagulans]